MKKFLSLVLALIMTMSLVTVSAGAAEYKDLTDKDEIQYEEAVAVLNRIGVITGYEDGSFRPETELTRGAAAKIIVSLLIGPEAASNLPNTYAPYPDVPANHTFAGVISYCKTAGIISGYGDGTFKPANSLTGYAFAKMLLGAIGYDSKIQGYTDTGWTMNVARDGNKAGLFNRIEFDGAAAVNREQACQLALNTLKATMVEYTGGLSVTAGDAHVTANPTLTYRISNQSYAANISNRKLNTQGNADANGHWTVEFGEEHFKDLRLNDEHGSSRTMARDKFGRPSNEWSFKKVTIGTFPIEPDFVYTTQVIHKDDEKVSDASKVRALELAGYELKKDTSPVGAVDTALFENGERTDALGKVAEIANYTDYGTKVEVYVNEDDADFIDTVVVVKTQLMEVKTIKSDAVALKLYDDGSDAEGVKADAKEAAAKGILYGYNQAPIDEDVNDVEVNDDCYDALKDMKVGDIVAVIPVWVDSTSKYDVAKVYTPETVSGELTSVDTYGTVNKGLPNAVKATVGGTAYNIALWNKDLYDIDGSKVRVTRKDVTLHLDEYGNAMLAKGVGSTSDYIVIGGYHSGLVDGKVVTFVDGWDIKGNELSLNIGNINYSGNAVVTTQGSFPIGNLARYTNASGDRYAEWALDYKSVYPVASERNGAADGNELPATPADRYNLKASNGKVLLNDYLVAATGAYNQSALPKDNDETAGYINTARTKNVDVDDAGVKVIYVTKDTYSNEVDSIEIKSGMQAISNDEIRGVNPVTGFQYGRAQACVNLKSGDVVTGDSVVKAIVIKKESGSANLSDLVYISSYIGSINKAVGTDASSKPVYGYQVHFLGQDNWDDEVTIYTTTSLQIGDFAKARKDANVPSISGVTEDNYYRTTRYGDTNGIQIHKALSVLPRAEIQKVFSNNKTLLKLMNYNNAENDIAVGATVPPAGNTTGLANIAGVFKTDVELDLGGEAANNIVSIRKAKIIDLTKNGIDSASDLKDLWDDVKDKVKGDNRHPLVKVSLVFNDKWDDDSFRTVYALVITDVYTGVNGTGVRIPGSDSDDNAPVVTPSNGAVKFASGYNTDGKYGAIKDDEVKQVDDFGKTNATFTLVAPDWAETVADADMADVIKPIAEITFDIYRDGEAFRHGGPQKITANGAGYGYLTANGDGTFTGTVTISNSSKWGLSEPEAKGHQISLVVTDIKWNFAKVEYYRNGEKITNASGVDYLPTFGTDGGTFKVSGLSANGTATVTGLTNDVGTLTVDKTAGATLSGQAKGGEPVKVDISGTVNYTVKVGTAANSGAVSLPLANFKLAGDVDAEDTSEIQLTFDNGYNNVAEGGSVSIKVKKTMSSLPAVVTIDVPEIGTKTQIVKGDATDTTFTLENVRRNITITGDMITVKPIMWPTPIGISVSGHYIAVEFDRPITLEGAKRALDSDPCGWGDYGTAPFNMTAYLDKGDTVLVVKYSNSLDLNTLGAGAVWKLPALSIASVVTIDGVTVKSYYDPCATTLGETNVNATVKALTDKDEGYNSGSVFHTTAGSWGVQSAVLPTITGITLPTT